MPTQQSIECISDMISFADFDTFAHNNPVEWVESAINLADKATIRRRRLPSEQVLWLVMGMALFRNEPISEVATRLNVCANA